MFVIKEVPIALLQCDYWCPDHVVCLASDWLVRGKFEAVPSAKASERLLVDEASYRLAEASQKLVLS